MKADLCANSCRICLAKSKKLRSLYKPVDEGDEPPNEMLNKLTGIVVEDMEQHKMLPKYICKNCELSLCMAFEFREKALQSQQVIAAFVEEHKLVTPQDTAAKAKATSSKSNKSSKKDSLVKTEGEEEQNNIQLEPSSDLAEEPKERQQQTAFDGLDGEEFLTEDLNEECLEEQEAYEEDDAASEATQQQQYEDSEREENEEETSREMEEEEAEEEDNEPSEHHYEVQIQNEDEANEKRWVLTEQEVEIDTEQCETPSAGDMLRRSRKPKKTIASAVGYICDVCGNVYTKKGRMMEHRQRHDKDLKYACELCDQKFHMRELLRKHMYSHFGGKPLKCEYCSRTFYYESVRKAHEAVHQGFKPYVCDICGKAFSYSHSLKKHKLIHTAVKLYRCNYCNKDFRLQHHMKQHEITKAHQKAVYMAQKRYVDVEIDQEVVIEDVLMDEEEIIEET